MEPEYDYVAVPAPKRRLARNAFIVGAALLVATPVFVNATGADEPLGDITAQPLPTTLTPPESTTTSMAEAVTTTVPSSAPRRVVTTQPRRTAVAAPSTDTGTGDVLTIDREGIWVVDTVDKTLRRLAPVEPFDTAGHNVLLSQGRTVFSVPVTGGQPQARYTLPNLTESPNGTMVSDTAHEAITMLEAAPDGTAFVASAAPMRDQSGALVGQYTGYHLVDSTGALRPTCCLDRHARFTDDGSVLVAFDYRGLRGVARDGTVLWGPVPARSTAIQQLHPTQDGLGAAVEFDAARSNLYRSDTNRWEELTSIYGDIDFGPDGRVVGQQVPPPGWDGFKPLSLVVWDPKTGGVTPVAVGGGGPDWSPDGRAFFHLHGDVGGTGYTFKVRRPTGEMVLTIRASSKALRLAYDDHGWDHSWPGPQWSSDGRYLVLIAAPTFSGPMPM